MPQYRVQVRRIVYEYQVVDVEAETPEKAKRLAVKQAKQNTDDFCDSTYGSVAAKSVELNPDK